MYHCQTKVCSSRMTIGMSVNRRPTYRRCMFYSYKLIWTHKIHCKNNVASRNTEGLFTTPTFFLRWFYRNSSIYLSSIYFHIFWCKSLICNPQNEVPSGVVTPTPRSQLVDKIETKFHRLPTCFWVQRRNERRYIVRTSRKWGLQYVGLQTRSIHILACRHDWSEMLTV